MKLGLNERFVILQILPQRESLSTLRIVRSLQMDLAPSEEETKKHNIRDEEDAGGNPIIAWDTDSVKDIEFGDKACEIVKTGIEAVSERGEATLELLDLYEKFGGSGPADPPEPTQEA